MSEAPKPIIDLIERFERNVESCRVRAYNRILKATQTIADLDAKDRIKPRTCPKRYSTALSIDEMMRKCSSAKSGMNAHLS
jgi:predicted ATPase with chaperone activity